MAAVFVHLLQVLSSPQGPIALHGSRKCVPIFGWGRKSLTAHGGCHSQGCLNFWLEGIRVLLQSCRNRLLSDIFGSLCVRAIQAIAILVTVPTAGKALAISTNSHNQTVSSEHQPRKCRSTYNFKHFDFLQLHGAFLVTGVVTATEIAPGTGVINVFAPARKTPASSVAVVPPN